MPVLGWGLVALGIFLVQLGMFQALCRVIMVANSQKVPEESPADMIAYVGLATTLGGIVVLNSF